MTVKEYIKVKWRSLLLNSKKAKKRSANSQYNNHNHNNHNQIIIIITNHSPNMLVLMLIIYITIRQYPIDHKQFNRCTLLSVLEECCTRRARDRV